MCRGFTVFHVKHLRSIGSAGCRYGVHVHIGGHELPAEALRLRECPTAGDETTQIELGRGGRMCRGFRVFHLEHIAPVGSARCRSGVSEHIGGRAVPAEAPRRRGRHPAGYVSICIELGPGGYIQPRCGAFHVKHIAPMSSEPCRSGVPVPVGRHAVPARFTVTANAARPLHHSKRAEHRATGVTMGSRVSRKTSSTQRNARLRGPDARHTRGCP